MGWFGLVGVVGVDGVVGVIRVDGVVGVVGVNTVVRVDGVNKFDLKFHSLVLTTTTITCVTLQPASSEGSR